MGNLNFPRIFGLLFFLSIYSFPHFLTDKQNLKKCGKFKLPKFWYLVSPFLKFFVLYKFQIPKALWSPFLLTWRWAFNLAVRHGFWDDHAHGNDDFLLPPIHFRHHFMPTALTSVPDLMPSWWKLEKSLVICVATSTLQLTPSRW